MDGAAPAGGRGWGRAAHDWAELQEPLAQPLWEVMLDAAGVGVGTRILDAGCGAGGAGVLAAARGALVNGLDAAPALVAIARRRVPDGDFRAGDVGALPYADAAFDAVLVADVVAAGDDPLAALREVRRVCAPHGRVVVAIGCVAEEGAHRALITALRALLPAAARETLLPLRAALSAPGALAALVARAGFAVLGAGSVDCPYDYQDLETLWRAQSSSGSLQPVLRLVGREALKAAMLRALDPYRLDTGGVVLHQTFRYVVAAPREGDPPAGAGRAGQKGGPAM